MQSKGTLGSIIAGVIAIFLVLICLFYLSFTLVSSHHEKKAEEYAAKMAGSEQADAALLKKHYHDSIKNEQVWLGYTYNEVQKWGIGLGLDLKGGMSVLLQVSLRDLITSMKDGAPDEAFTKALDIADQAQKNNPETDYVVTFYDAYTKEAPNANLSKVFAVDGIKSGSSRSEVLSALRKEIKDRVDNSATNVLRSRIDAYGVVSPNIQVLQGKDGQILLELPGVKDKDDMLNLLQRQAKLQFFASYKDEFGTTVNTALGRIDDAADNQISKLSKNLIYKADNRGRVSDQVDRVEQGLHMSNPVVGYFLAKDTATVGNILRAPQYAQFRPDGIQFRWAHIPEKHNKAEYFALYALKSNKGVPAMSGDHVVNARADFDSNQNTQVVSMDMDSEGAKEWARVTGDNIGWPVAIVLDNEVYSAPRVNDKITGGSSQITGNFDVQEAQNLANVLKSGKMTARVEPVQTEVIGPSLGQQAIDKGIVSFIVALVLLMILMISYYGVIPGLIANLGLILNLFFTFGILASFQAVLTLSGIAGIVLALGMAVDANVLIFERTKEELHAGKNARTAIADGYSNAFSAIFDSNLTSIITGVILLLYGTGPIKGFATTLIIGIACSFFTAVYLTRIVFILGAKKKCFENLTFTTKLSRKMFDNTNVNFLGKRKISFTVVAAMVVIVLVSFFVRGLNQGIDFSGGRNYVVMLDKAEAPADLQARLTPVFEGAQVSVIKIEDKNQVRVSTNYKIAEPDSVVENEIINKLYNTLQPNLKEGMKLEEFKTTDQSQGIVSSQKVGPTVADDMRNDAYVAVTLSLIAMFLYILLRFRNIAFSLGALAAVAFTAFTIVGFYSLFWGILPFAMEIDQTFIAAILTVIGYQINDTVVVFDRVRENTALYPKKSFFDIINSSINSTLGRTIMTSGSTLLVLLSIFFLGGDTLRSFIFAMIFGVIIGTCATIFIAAPVAYITDSRRKNKQAAAK
ncbi:MAG: protein translocase subunit SecDF [Bacteroidales bacterium]|nr:protein translocase subunit SecDF [Bacteroidales bacterium]MBD5235405.1 protein translocase subunit SecDF [Barnesiella sp.]MBD5259086.1 protein translocase subunit SecDF [Barnesiella sp.]